MRSTRTGHGHLFTLIGLCCLLITAAARAEVLTHTSTTTEFLELIGTIEGDAQASVPLGTHLNLALDAHGGLLVTDPDHRRVLRYHAAAGRLEPVPVPSVAKDRLFAPQGIAIDAQGRLFLTNPDLHELLVVDNQGVLLGGMGGFDSPFERPIDLAIGARGRLYVLDQAAREVVILVPCAVNTRRVPNSSKARMGQKCPPPNWRGNCCAQHLDRAGSVLDRQSLRSVTQPSARSDLSALAVARDGTIYVTDSSAHQILRLAPSGAIHRLSMKDPTSGERISPEGVAVDARGDIIVSDAVHNALYKFAAHGGMVQEYVLYKRLLQQPSQLVLEGEHLWVVNAGTRQILHFRLRQARMGLEHALLGEEYMALGYHRRALAQFQTAVTLGYDTVEVRFLLGVASYDLKEYPPAIAALRSVLEQQPDHVEALLQLGNAYAKLGRYAQAEDAYRRVLGYDPRQPVAHYNLGEVYFALGSLGKAEHQFRQTLILSPTYAAAHVGLGRVFLERQQYDKAEVAFRKALQSPLHQRAAQHYLGITFFKAGRLQAAIAMLEKAASQGPHFIEALYYLGLAYAATGMKAQAIANFQRVLELQPQHAGALRELARLR